MATNVKNAIAKALINGVVTDLFLKTGVENVVITENGSEKTLADKLTEIITALNGKATPADITNALGSYVKKEAGKGLSANDFTTELMTKLNGIAAGAQVNKIESIKVNGTAQTIGADKSVNITVPTKTSDLTNDKKYQTDTEVATAVQTAISKTGHASYQKVSAVPTVDAAQENILYLVMNSTTKHYDIYAKIKGSSGSYTMEQLDDTTVDLTGYIKKETGKGLSTNDYTTAEKQKLANIADGAQVNKMESVKVNGAAQAIAADKSVNQGNIDWDAVKASGKVDCVLLKTVSTNSKFSKRKDGLYIDPTFERNYAECKRVGLPVGVYYYTYATTKAMADAELAVLKTALAGKTFEMPVCVDVEDNKLVKLNKGSLTALVDYELRTLESWSVYALLYTGLNFSLTRLNMAKLKAYDVWVAAYRKSMKKPATSYKYGIWQYTDEARIPGVSTNADMSYAYKDYPAIIERAGLSRVKGA